MISNFSQKSSSPVAIFKLGQKEYMSNLVHRGDVYMNTLTYFSELERNSPKVDPEEGTAYCFNAEGAVLKVQKSNEWQTLGTLKGGIRYKDGSLMDSNIYSLHAKFQNNYGNVFQLEQLNLGDYYVLFKD